MLSLTDTITSTIPTKLPEDVMFVFFNPLHYIAALQTIGDAFDNTIVMVDPEAALSLPSAIGLGVAYTAVECGHAMPVTIRPLSR